MEPFGSFSFPFLSPPLLVCFYCIIIWMGGGRGGGGGLLLAGVKIPLKFYEYGTSFYATTVYCTMNSGLERV